MWEIQLDYGILITGHRKTIKNWDQPQQSSTKKDTEQNIQFGALCRGGKKIFLFRYLELSRVFISAGVQHPQLLCFVLGQDLEPPFPFFSEFLFTFLSLFTVTSYSLYPFLCFFRPIRLRTFSSGSEFSFFWTEVFLTGLTCSEACWSHECVFLCCVVCGSGLLVGAKETFAPLPSLSSASPSQASGSHHLGWLEGCTALPSPHDADQCTIIHNGQIQKESHVLAGTIIACCYHPCVDFLLDCPQYTWISVQNSIKFLLKLFKKIF